MVVQSYWLTLEEVVVPQAAEMETLLACLSPGHPRLPHGYPNNGQGLRTPGVPDPALPSPPTAGLPFPGAGNRVANDARKIQRHGDDPEGSTVPRLVEGDDD